MMKNKNLWVVSISRCPKYVTTTKEKALELLKNYLEEHIEEIEEEYYGKEDIEMIMTEVEKYNDFIENVCQDYSCAIDEVLYED